MLLPDKNLGWFAPGPVDGGAPTDGKIFFDHAFVSPAMKALLVPREDIYKYEREHPPGKGYCFNHPAHELIV